MLAVIKSFHTSMAAVLRMSGTTVDPFSAHNGLRQGCSIAPMLFNIFMWAVVSRWQQRVSGVPGIGFSFSHNTDPGNLYRKSHRTDPVTTATEAQFADDSALVAISRAGAEVALTTFDNTVSEFGLAVSATKTKFLVAGADVSVCCCPRTPQSSWCRHCLCHRIQVSGFGNSQRQPFILGCCLPHCECLPSVCCFAKVLLWQQAPGHPHQEVCVQRLCLVALAVRFGVLDASSTGFAAALCLPPPMHPLNHGSVSPRMLV